MLMHKLKRTQESGKRKNVLRIKHQKSRISKEKLTSLSSQMKQALIKRLAALIMQKHLMNGLYLSSVCPQ